MFFTFLIRLSQLYSFVKATMVWKLETVPAIFGKDVILKCTIPQNSFKNMQSRRWLGGNDLYLLTMNGFSINNAKYSEKFNKENKTFVLIIHYFDVMDINVAYECIYGSSAFVKMLNLTEDKFEYEDIVINKIARNRQKDTHHVLHLFDTSITALLICKSYNGMETGNCTSNFWQRCYIKMHIPAEQFQRMQFRRWHGGNDLHLLTMNGFSIDNAKYSEKFNKENKTFVLIIHDFDVMDINVPYECIYGSSAFVKMLNLTEDKFEYHPSGPYTELYETINDTNTLSVNISTEIVYPRPKCSAAMNINDLTFGIYQNQDDNEIVFTFLSHENLGKG